MCIATLRFALLAVCVGVASPSLAIDVSSDITVDLSGSTFDDEQVVADDQVGGVVQVPLGAIPFEADVGAYHREGNDRLFALDTAVDLPGGLHAGPEDVVRFDGAVYTLEFDGTAAGIPAGVAVDAVTRDVLGNLLLSFDTTVDLVALTAGPEDLVEFDGVSFVSPAFFDGTAEGIAAGTNLDGAGLQPTNGHLLLSFDVSGVIASVAFDDEDALEFDPGGPTWSLAYDGSANHPGWVGGDVTAVPEPGFLLQILAGGALLAALHRARGRS